MNRWVVDLVLALLSVVVLVGTIGLVVVGMRDVAYWLAGRRIAAQIRRDLDGPR